MGFIKYAFVCKPDQSEALLGLLSDLPFDSFWEEAEGTINAYLDESFAEAEITEKLNPLREVIPFSLEIEKMEATNWNAVWESNFQPVQIGQFCGIRASFHPSFDPPVTHEILIDPKMAFGTGHHETTSLVISMMQDLNWKGKSVFDYGCGTGVLAILAKMLGAGLTDAVDIEEPAYENTLENVENNGVGEIRVYHGDIEAVPKRTYDLILANINRNVILASLEELANRLNPGGVMIISGFLKADVVRMVKAVEETGFKIRQTRENNQWISMELEKHL
ncbi:MAG: 50S ribosomal protein L11 methyltransferase [Bacteroidetes bacterium]|nr:50S ribosomal protein L11 methyltransferase [Bacteroidota bacterium]